DDRAHGPEVCDRRVLHDRVVVVVHERVVQRVQVHGAAEQRRDERQLVPAFHERQWRSYPMRILHVSPYAPDAWAYGGIPRLVGTLTRELARRGHQVTLCTTDAHGQRTR